MAEFRHE